MWLHLGALGPKRVIINDDGTMPSPPYTVTDNTQSWFEHFDLVFVDPPHTGYSLTASEEARKKMLSVDGDVAALAESDQALIDEAHREELRGIARVRRVERRGQTWHADVKLARRCADGHARDGQQQRREPHEARRRHGALEPTPPTREPATHRRPL